jgi:hypothetical protein
MHRLLDCVTERMCLRQGARCNYLVADLLLLLLLLLLLVVLLLLVLLLLLLLA